MGGVLNGILPGTDPNASGYVQSQDQIARQQQLAQLMLQDGTSTTPIASPWQGAARLAQTLAGSYMRNKANQEQQIGQASGAANDSNFLNNSGVLNDPGGMYIPATPGRTTPALQQNDQINDATIDNQDAGMSSNAALIAALAASRGGQPQSAGGVLAGGAPPSNANPALAAALGGAPVSPTSGGSGLDPQAVSAYVAQAAQQRGINPAVAGAVLGTESGNGASYVGDKGSSFGPLQLHYGGIAPGVLSHPGLGDAFKAATGLDARNPATWRQQIDFALDQAKVGGWGPWATTRDKLGISNFTGIRSGAPSPSAYANPSPSASASSPAVAAIANAAPAPGTINRTPTPVAPSVGTMSGRPPPPDIQPASGQSELGMRGTESANAAPASPAPSPANLALIAAMQPWTSNVQPQGFGGDHLSANAAEVNNPPLPALTAAGALSAPIPQASPAGPQPPLPANVPLPPVRPPGLGAPAVPPGAPMQLPSASGQGSLDTATAPGGPPAQATPPSPALAPPQSAPAGSMSGFHPDIASALNILSDPWASPAAQQIAQQMISMQMPAAPTFGVIGKGADGSESYGWIYPKGPTGPHVTDANGNPVNPGQGNFNISSSPGATPAPQGAPSPATGAPGAPVTSVGAGTPQPQGNGAKIPNLPAIGLTPEGAAWLSSVAQQGGDQGIVARKAMAIINGQAQLPDGGGTGPTKPFDIAVTDAVFKAAPGYSATLAASRAKAISEFQDKSSPTSRGGLVQNMNTGLGHLADLSDLSERLPTNSDSTFWPNSIVNAGKTALVHGPNATDLAAYNQAKAIVTEEVTKFYQGGPGAEGDRDAMIAKLSPDASPSERRAGIAAISKLIQTKGTEIQRDWHQATSAPDGQQYDYPIYGAEALDGMARIAQRASPNFGVTPGQGGRAPAAPPPAVMGAIKANPQGALSDAKAAIAARPDLRGAIIQRLQAAGVDPTGL